MAEVKQNIIEQLVIIENKSLTTAKLCQFFYKTSNWFNDTELVITTSGSEYLEFCRGVISEAYNITCISIVSDSKQQCENVFNIHYKEAHGQEDVITLAPVLDPYQLVAQIDAYQIPKIEFNGLNTLNYYVLPNTKVWIYFQLDKSQTITEAFKIHSQHKDFSKPIIKELVLDEKEKEKCDCDDKEQKNYPERILLKHVAKVKTVINIDIPDIPCRQDPNILEYPLKLSNVGNENVSIDIFRRTTFMYNAFQFILPYSATYNSGFYVEVTTDQGVSRFDATSTITREQLISELNKFNIGIWKVSDDTDANIYTCFSLTHTLLGLFYQASSLRITVQPVSQNAHETDSVTFSITVVGSGTITYQWRKNGVDILGANSNTYTINPLAISDVANYTCYVENGIDNELSNTAALQVYHWVAKTSGSSDNILKVFGV